VVTNAVTTTFGSGSFYVGFYLSTDATITTSDQYIGYRWLVDGLTPGATSTLDTTVSIPNTMIPGTYYIGAIADISNQVGESDETNNAFAGNQIVVVGPDLTMTAVSGPASAVTGGSIVVTNAVTTTVEPRSFFVMIYLSVDATITTSDQGVGGRWVNLAPGATSILDTTVSIPNWLEPGTYYIGVVADHNNLVAEMDETNNALAGNQIVVTGSDLMMTAVSSPANAVTGGSIAVSNSVTTVNGAPQFYVGIYLSADETITTSDRWIGNRSVASLASGATSTLDTTVSIPNGLEPGTYYIGAVADMYNMVAEMDETNNALAGNQIVVIGPDLTMTAVSAPVNAVTGETIAVNNSVTTVNGAAYFSVGIYLSADETITTADRWIGSRSVASLASGATSTLDTTVLIPNALVPGTYYIGAIADYGNVVVEYDETNNTLAGNQIVVGGP
jgi:subtilase family serine protease